MLKNALMIGVSLLAVTASARAAENNINQLNPQPEPPGVTDSAASGKINELNPQPEPPGVTDANNPGHKATWAAGSDSGNDRKINKPSLSAGSDSSDDKKVNGATWVAGSDSGNDRKAHGATWVAGSDSGNDSHSNPDHGADSAHDNAADAINNDFGGIGAPDVGGR